MEIKKYYKESNEICDISGDYVVIKMSSDLFTTLKTILSICSLYDKKLERKSRLIRKEIDKALDEEEAEWY